jgi:hypothetical protein
MRPTLAANATALPTLISVPDELDRARDAERGRALARTIVPRATGAASWTVRSLVELLCPARAQARELRGSLVRHGRVIPRPLLEVKFVTQVGRNDPCPCGSGKKYKKCCLAKDEESVRERARAVREAEHDRETVMRELAARRATRAQPASVAKQPTWWLEEDDLTELTNSVIDLIDERRYDDALVACERLLHDYPEVHDGFERSALVHDALGNHALAADFWQKAVDFVEHPDRRYAYDEELIDDFRQHLMRSRERAQAECERTPTTEDDRAP